MELLQVEGFLLGSNGLVSRTVLTRSCLELDSPFLGKLSVILGFWKLYDRCSKYMMNWEKRSCQMFLARLSNWQQRMKESFKHGSSS